VFDSSLRTPVVCAIAIRYQTPLWWAGAMLRAGGHGGDFHGAPLGAAVAALAPVPPSENTSPTGWAAGPRARSARRRRPR
jgi:hypothetical protein